MKKQIKALHGRFKRHANHLLSAMGDVWGVLDPWYARKAKADLANPEVPGWVTPLLVVLVVGAVSYIIYTDVKKQPRVAEVALSEDVISTPD